jgi:hypothetical protein
LKGELKEYNRGSELIQSELYVSLELSQWNHLVLLMYANKKTECLVQKAWWV